MTPEAEEDHDDYNIRRVTKNEMNIFVLSLRHHVAATALVDKHVVKMILESAQLLSTAFVCVVPEHRRTDVQCYKKTHANHPCAVWTRERKVNFVWLGLLSLAIGKEYTFRYKKIHKSESVIRPMLRRVLELDEEELRFTTSNAMTPIVDFPLAMPENIRGKTSRASPLVAIRKYREYYTQKCEHDWAAWNKGRHDVLRLKRHIGTSEER